MANTPPKAYKTSFQQRVVAHEQQLAEQGDIELRGAQGLAGREEAAEGPQEEVQGHDEAHEAEANDGRVAAERHLPPPGGAGMGGDPEHGEEEEEQMQEPDAVRAGEDAPPAVQLPVRLHSHQRATPVAELPRRLKEQRCGTRHR